jgi:hypothetical protein
MKQQEFRIETHDFTKIFLKLIIGTNKHYYYLASVIVLD